MVPEVILRTFAEELRIVNICDTEYGSRDNRSSLLSLFSFMNISSIVWFQGNVNYARARQALMESKRFGDRLKQLFPIIESGMSDSGCFDNLLEFLCYCSTRSLPEVVISMIPEAWQADQAMPEHKRYFYKWAASLLEPWDGPGELQFLNLCHFLGVFWALKITNINFMHL